MIYAKETFPTEQFEQSYLTLWDYCFIRHIDISKPPNMAKALAEHYTQLQVEDILKAASLPKYKEALTATTKHCVEDCGAFGAPWFWIKNAEGKSEPFFGSDRWAYMWDFLDVPHQNVEILEKEKEKDSAKL